MNRFTGWIDFTSKGMNFAVPLFKIVVNNCRVIGCMYVMVQSTYLFYSASLKVLLGFLQFFSKSNYNRKALVGYRLTSLRWTLFLTTALSGSVGWPLGSLMVLWWWRGGGGIGTRPRARDRTFTKRTYPTCWACFAALSPPFVLRNFLRYPVCSKNKRNCREFKPC